MKTTKLLLLFAVAVMSTGCCDNKSLKRPFTIIDKAFEQHDTIRYYKYEYVDANGRRMQFDEFTDKYSIGDTIK